MHKIDVTCGIFLFYGKELLICHPTGANETNWSIPKGLSEENETTLHTALREFKEEVGVDVQSVSSKVLYIGNKIYRTKRKELCGFISVCEKEKPTNLFCSSFTSTGKPEVDIIEWTPIMVAIKLIHEAQRTLLLEFMDKYNKGKINENIVGLENIGELRI
jgi:8-oxo-dGTP pyrophosphatase MutT (NUDIX family)